MVFSRGEGSLVTVQTGRWRTFIVLAWAGLMALSCGSRVQQGLTGVELTVTSGVVVEQLRMRGFDEEGATLFDQLVPETPRPLEGDGESVVILVSPDRAGQLLALVVFGRVEGAVVSEGFTSVRLEQGRLVQALVELLPGFCGDGSVQSPREVCDDRNNAPADGCTPRCQLESGYVCQGTPSVCLEVCGSLPCGPGQRCEEGVCLCDQYSCFLGCCRGGLCLQGDALDACGLGGGLCVSCDDRSDSCSDNGLCRCGASPPCHEGQHCVEGQCECGPHSCPLGCCDDGRLCREGNLDEACGSGGNDCNDCEGDGCEQGRCASCQQECPDGCCSGAICYARSPKTCGIGGVSCLPCPEGRADFCDVYGECLCGSSAACLEGYRCVRGRCRCDEETCPGCCSSDTCVTVPSVEVCGDGQCRACSGMTADGCNTSFECVCGAGPECEPGLRCVDGTCVCDALSSCDGCCAGGGSSCEDGTSTALCGSGGQECRRCPARKVCDSDTRQCQNL